MTDGKRNLVLMRVLRRPGPKYSDPEYILIIHPYRIESDRPISCVIDGRSYYGHCEACVEVNDLPAIVWLLGKTGGKSVMIHLSPLLFETI